MITGKVSVIVPLHNYAHYIEENIQSIQKQSFGHWELIIVDDASTDQPHKVIKPYLSDQIRLIRKDKNEGYGAAKNTGLRMSVGEFIVILDADDTLPSASLHHRVKFLKAHKLKWVHGNALEFYNHKPYEYNFVKRKSYKRFIAIKKSRVYDDVWRCIHAQTVMVERAVYELVGLYDESFRSMGDKEMWARIVNHVGPPGYLNKPLVYYRQHGEQMHRSKWKLKNLAKLEKQLHKVVKARATDLEGIEKL